MKKVLITGVSGFLGHHVTNAFHKEDITVIGVDKRPIPPNHLVPHQFIQTRVEDLGFRDLQGIDYVVHLAWRTNIPDCIRHPVESTEDNILMTAKLLEKCKEAGISKFAFPSTASLYGHNETPWHEDMRPDMMEPYSWQKFACEELCKLYAKDMPVVIYRFFQVFGELQRTDTALSAFIKKKEAGEPITLTETTAQSSFKSGQRDFIYAGDLARFVFLSVVNPSIPSGEIYNVASGQFNTMEEIAHVLGAEIKWIPRREHEVERHHGDISKAQTLGWTPKTNVLEWVKQYAKM